jgi:hypothetical protein
VKGRRLAIGAAAAFAVLAVAAGGYTLYERTNPTEQALAQLRDTPLVGLAITDHPEIEDRLRRAIREEQRNPTTSGPTRPLVVIGELRRDVIAPVLRNADDPSVIAAMQTRVALVRYLQKADPPACREFFMGGIAHPEKLDAEAQRLLRNVLVAMEGAYRSGRKGTPQPMPSAAQVHALLLQAGFTKADFDRLASAASLSNDVSCEMELKVDSAPPLLAPDKRGPYSRFVVAR